MYNKSICGNSHIDLIHFIYPLNTTTMRFYFIVLSFLCFSIQCVSAQNNLRETIAVVRPEYDDATVSFLNDFSKSLARDGYYTASELLKSYAKGGFGTGFVYKDPETGKAYVVTNKHVVAQAEYMNVEFMLSGRTSEKYENCQIIAIHEELDIALIALPDDYETSSSLLISARPSKDGAEVFTAGFPGLGTKPSWQLGKGIISNSELYLEELTGNNKTYLIQHTAQVDAGSSGSPLLVKNDDKPFGYEVIGINTWKAVGRENANFAIPASSIISFLEDYLNGEDKSSLEALNKRVNDLISQEDIDYKKILPFISYGYTSKMSLTSFYELINAASKEAQDDIKNNFQNGSPIESIRIGLADAIAKNLSGKKVTIESIDNFITNGNQVRVVLKQNNKKITTEWVKEQNQWRISSVSNLNTRALEKGVSKTYGYKNSVRVGMELPVNNDQFARVYNFTFGRTIRTFMTYEVNVNLPTYYKIEYENYNDATRKQDTIKVEQTGFGMDFSIGGQLPIKAGSFFIIPYLKGSWGVQFLEEGVSGFGLATGVELAYKLRKNCYVLVGGGYKLRYYSKNHDIRPYDPLNAIDLHLGITF